MVVDKELPRIVLQSLEGGEAKLGKYMLWLILGLFAVMVLLFFVTPEPVEEKMPAVPWVLGVVAFFVGWSVWVMRKPYRVHRMMVAKVLRERPAEVVAVHEIAIRPAAHGQGVVQTRVTFDGEREFSPREQRIVRVLGLVKIAQRSQIYVKIRGKLFARRLVVPSDRAPELLSWLFATLASANPECRWGETTIASHTG